MSDNGWPGTPGVPLNPERDGWHWISLLGGKNAQVIEWFSDAMRWDETDWTTDDFGLHTRYLGPCLTPAEVAARIAQARRDALEEAEIAAKKAGERHKEIARRIGFEPTIDGAIGHACADIRALKGEGDE